MDPVRYETPDDAILAAAADRVEQRVLDDIRHAPRSRWRRVRNVAGVVAAGLGLFAGGLVVGAAALPKDARADWGTTIGADGEVIAAGFAIGCFTSERAVVPSITFSEAKGDGQRLNRKSPASVCSTEVKIETYAGALGLEAHDKGGVCGYIAVEPPGTKWKFLYSFSPGTDGRTTSGFDGQPIEWPAGCDSTSGLTISPIYSTPTAVCELADNRAGVYPLKHGTAAQLCARLGFPVWGR